MDTMETTAATAAALTIRTDLIAGTPSLAHLAGPKGPALHSFAGASGGSKRTRPTLLRWCIWRVQKDPPYTRSLAHLAGPKGPALHSFAGASGGSKRTRPTLVRWRIWRV